MTNSRTSSRRSPRSYLETNDWGLLIRVARSCCVNPASLRAATRRFRKASYSSVKIDFKTASPNRVLERHDKTRFGISQNGLGVAVNAALLGDTLYLDRSSSVSTLGLSYLMTSWVAGDDAFGMSPSFREGLAALGMRYVLDVPGSTTVWPLEPAWTSPDYPGFGRPRKPRLVDGQRRTMEQRSAELPDEAWREITVAQGSQGPRTYRFSAQRVRVTRRRKPGEEIWAVWRRNLDGSEPRYYRSNAPEDTTLETLAYVGGSRWRIETEFETEKGDVGLDEYETRSWAGWHHHIAMGLLGGAFLLGLQQDWGEDAPDHPSAGVPGSA